MLSLSKENGIISVSPGCSSNTEKSIVGRKTLGGVPVFRRPVTKPNLFNTSVSPTVPCSPSRPQGASYVPIKIFPPRNVLL